MICSRVRLPDGSFDFNLVDVDLREFAVSDGVVAGLDNTSSLPLRKLIRVLLDQSTPQIPRIHQAVAKSEARCEAGVQPDANRVPRALVGQIQFCQQRLDGLRLV